MRDLNNLTVFLQVAELKSYTQAARRLGLTSSAVSKCITRIESELNATLFVRNTRHVYLTNDGADFYERCKLILGQLEEAELSLKRSRNDYSGTLRIQMPMGFGRKVVFPKLPVFRSRYPEIELDIEMSNRIVDMVYERIDVCVVSGPVTDERLVARKLCDVQHVACASPAYLARHGEPQTPDDLEHHHCMAFMITNPNTFREWKFTYNGRTFSKRLSGKLNMNQGESLLEAAINGEGIAMLNTYFLGDAVQRGLVKIILKDWIAKGPHLSIAYLPNRKLSPKVRAFIDFLIEIAPGSANFALQ
ncbi:LysR family transcriptional regulator [Pigmentiphaga soli]|uniref:LysR family transcriptional regulator n=1 Tax=Pigmentiphaga soli TaxID=1007095 RepID=A0ABP8H8Q3_9BURK